MGNCECKENKNTDHLEIVSDIQKSTGKNLLIEKSISSISDPTKKTFLLPQNINVEYHSWFEVTLTEKQQLQPDVVKLTFTFPKPNHMAGLFPGECFLFRVEFNEERYLRIHYPITKSSQLGHFSIISLESSDHDPTPHIMQHQWNIGEKVSIKKYESNLKYYFRGKLMVRDFKTNDEFKMLILQKICFIVESQSIFGVYSVVREIIENKGENVGVEIIIVKTGVLCLEQEMEGFRGVVKIHCIEKQEGYEKRVKSLFRNFQNNIQQNLQQNLQQNFSQNFTQNLSLNYSINLSQSQQKKPQNESKEQKNIQQQKSPNFFTPPNQSELEENKDKIDKKNSLNDMKVGILLGSKEFESQIKEILQNDQDVYVF